MAVTANFYGQVSSLNASDPLAVGLIGWWPLAEGGGGIAFDATGSGNNGTIIAPTWTVGPSGSGPGTLAVINAAQKFDFATNLVRIPDNPTLSPAAGTAVTMAAWLYVIDPGSYIIGVISKRNDTLGTGYAYAISLRIPDLLYVYTAGVSGVQNFGGSFVQTGRWFHLAATISAAPTELYINGLLVGTQGAGGGIAQNTAAVCIGSSGISSGGANQELFDGWIADARIYNRRLSPSEVQMLYQRTRRPIAWPRPSVVSNVPSVAAPGYRARVVRWG